jgi:tripartite-type tricarboxylate transporter receptor subunit TctC
MNSFLCAAVALSVLAASAAAQEKYPSRAIAITVPNPPGGMN